MGIILGTMIFYFIWPCMWLYYAVPCLIKAVWKELKFRSQNMKYFMSMKKPKNGD